MSGPARKPTKIKELEGNAGKRPLPANEPKPARDERVPECPAYLKGIARQEWKRAAGELYRLGLLTKVDHAMFEAYCSAYQDAVEATKERARLKRLHREYLKRRRKDSRERPASNGMVCFTSNGNVIMEPMVSVEKQAWERVKAFALEFGMSPASRTRISAGKGGGNKPPVSAMQRYQDAKREISN